MSKRIVVTGMGALTPLGSSVESTWQRLLDGQSGIQELAGDATLLYYLTDEAQEGKNAFLEKRKPNFKQYPKFP